MKELNLYRLWEVCNRLSNEQDKLAEQEIYVSLLGNQSNYCNPTFESFLEYYSFKVEDDFIVVFNDDKVQYEDYSNGDFSSIPIQLLFFSDENLNTWMEEEVKKELEQQELEKIQEKEGIKLEIERLNKRLNGI